MTAEVARNPSPPPPSGARPASTQPPTPWRGAAFEAALNQASERRQTMDVGEWITDRDLRDDEQEPVSGRDVGRREDRADAGKKETREDKLEALMGGLQPQGGAAAALAAAQGAVGSTGDAQAMAMMMEKAWLAAQADASKGMHMQFTDRNLALAGFGVMRLADGGLSLQLTSRQRPTAELENAMELLRKRLEQRGVHIDEVTLESADGAPLRGIERTD